MKHDDKPSIVKMETETLKHLVKEVEERVATDLKKNKAGKNSIKVVDLWNIHRKKRATHSLMRSRAI
jgi:hypothetical protein